MGFEILVAQPEHPDANLLGERETDVAQPLVVTVEELESNFDKSRFGRARNFELDHAKLRVEIKGFRLGEGVSDCITCKNSQELTAELILKSNYHLG